MSFSGVYNHSLDAMGRIFVPAKFREELGECFKLFKSNDGCVFAYPESAWEKIIAQASLGSDTPEGRRRQRQLAVLSRDASLDAKGRVMLPDDFLKHAGINSAPGESISSGVTVVGAGTRIELWSSEVWNRYMSETEDDLLSIGINF